MAASPFVLHTALCSKSISLEETAMELLSENMDLEREGNKRDTMAGPPTLLSPKSFCGWCSVCVCVCVCVHAHTCPCLPTLCFNGYLGFQEAFLFL